MNINNQLRFLCMATSAAGIPGQNLQISLIFPLLAVNPGSSAFPFDSNADYGAL
jgi:hypothetical protein